MKGTEKADKGEILGHTPESPARTKTGSKHPVTPGLIKVYQAAGTYNKTGQHHDKERFQRSLVHQVAADQISRGGENS